MATIELIRDDVTESISNIDYLLTILDDRITELEKIVNNIDKNLTILLKRDLICDKR